MSSRLFLTRRSKLFGSRQVVLFSFALIALSATFCDAADLRHYQTSLQTCQTVVDRWQTQANLQIAMAIAVAVFGALITAFQGITKGWAKRITAVLGVCTVVFTGVTTKLFSADYRVLQQAAIDGADIVDQLAIIVDRMGAQISEADRHDLEAQWARTMTQFRGLQKDVLKGTHDSKESTEPSVSDSWLLAPTVVHAQMKAQRRVPSWVTSPPSDPSNRYFVGTAEDSSLTAAREKSLAMAVAAATRQMQTKSTKMDALKKYVTAASQVESTTFTYDAGKGVYRFSTLLRLSKEAFDLGADFATCRGPAQGLRILEFSRRGNILSWKVNGVSCTTKIQGVNRDGTRIDLDASDESAGSYDITKDRRRFQIYALQLLNSRSGVADEKRLTVR